MSGAYKEKYSSPFAAGQWMPFSYSGREIGDIERLLSPERFAGYVRRAGGDRFRALKLYERNTALSGALYEAIQHLEVPLRNAIHAAVAPTHGSDWYETCSVLVYPLPEMVREAKLKLEEEVRKGRKRQVRPGDMIAELRFGFWTALLGRKYEQALWVPSLRKAFPNAWWEKRISHNQFRRFRHSRHDIASRFEGIRTLRNRIAHHECILDRDPAQSHAEIMEAIHWLCATTGRWADETSPFASRDTATLA